VRSPALVALAPVIAALLFAGSNARAEEGELADALAEFADAEKSLATSAPCETMCKALQSMIRAADRICELAHDGTATDQKRCTDARAKVADATARVRASCPNCEPSPPYAPSTAPTPKPMEPKTGTVDKAPAPPPEPTATGAGVARADESVMYEAAAISKRATTTVSLDVIPLYAPPWLVQARLERSVARRFSVAIIGASGSLPKTGPDGAGRSSVLAVGGEARGYVFGTFDRFGIFVGADLVYRSASNVLYREYLEARAFPLGLTAGALVGTKLVFGGGITIEARVGPSVVIDDKRAVGPRDRVIPNGGISLGWTF
jgi:hypothetical protein